MELEAAAAAAAGARAAGMVGAGLTPAAGDGPRPTAFLCGPPAGACTRSLVSSS